MLFILFSFDLDVKLTIFGVKDYVLTIKGVRFNMEMKKILPEDVYVSVLTKEVTEEQLWLGMDTTRPGRKPSGCFFLDAFVDLMHEKLRYARASAYADGLGVELEDLYGYLRVVTGISFRDWRDRYLLLMVKELLRDTEKGCLEIARFLGFDSNTAFSQWATPLLGKAPTAWRREQQIQVSR